MFISQRELQLRLEQERCDRRFSCMAEAEWVLSQTAPTTRARRLSSRQAARQEEGMCYCRPIEMKGRRYSHAQIYKVLRARRLPRPWSGQDWVDCLRPVRDHDRLVRSIERMGYIL